MKTVVVGDINAPDTVIVPCKSFGAPGFEAWELEYDVVLPVDVAERLVRAGDRRLLKESSVSADRHAQPTGRLRGPTN